MKLTVQRLILGISVHRFPEEGNLSKTGLLRRRAQLNSDKLIEMIVKTKIMSMPLFSKI